MAVEVKIPAVGESITSGVVSVWHKKSGEYVNPGDALFTLETDKVSTEITAEAGGVLETRVNEGQEVKIGDVVATIDDSKSASEPPPKQSGPSAPASAKPSTEAPPLSPAVRRIVEEEKLEPGRISGTGKGGRLTKGDALAAADRHSVGEAVSLPGKLTASPTAPEPAAVLDGASQDDRFVRRKMSPLRRKIAAQLVMAQHTA